MQARDWRPPQATLRPHETRRSGDTPQMSNRPHNSTWQFDLRAMFLVTTIVASVLAVYRFESWAFALGAWMAWWAWFAWMAYRCY